ncbi:hypothetical protein [Desulfosarcina sp.]|uniref:hypothetical protein n=1 Tax=Desulfosarcina sp. TaxID=2027861 RepID=UPI003970F2B5
MTRLAGILVALMTAASIGHGLAPALPSWPSGLFAWAAALLLVSRVSRVQFLQTVFLLLIGVSALAAALSLGAEVPWLRLLDSNAGLLSMLAAVSFLQLITIARGAVVAKAQRGPGAFGRTLLSVAVFGGFINISAMLLVANRLARERGLSAFACQSITRAFSGCPTWSPFFAGMAVVLTYVAETNLLFVMLVGLPFSVVGLLLVFIEAIFRYRQELTEFEGYPLTVASLWLPCLLAVAVCLGHVMLPGTSILDIIALSALAVTGGVLLISRGAVETGRQLSDFVQQGLPMMVGELLLFLGAGVLAVGLHALATVMHLNLPVITAFDATAAGLLLAGLIVPSMFGAHPIITISVVVPLLAPINPDPQLLAVTLLFGWGLGTCAGPMSGTHLVMQGRYGISSLKGAMRNWSYVALMYPVALLFLFVVAMIRKV